MIQILKYFLGVIGILILVYVLIVLLRTVLISGATTGLNIISDSNTQNSVASNTKELAQAFGEFSLASWLRSFRPFAYAPIEVSTEVSDRATPKYYNDELTNYNTGAWRENLNWQNLNQAPNTHPTDFVPIGNSYLEELDDVDSNAQPVVPVSDMFIRPSTQQGEVISNNSIISGKAFYRVFTQGRFPIYVLDEQGNTISMVIAYANGDMAKDGWAPFRAVISTENIYVRRGFLMFKSENYNISQIKAVNVVPVRFAK